jgi:hypothetical protein
VDAPDKRFGASQPFGKPRITAQGPILYKLSIALLLVSFFFLTGTQGVDPLLLVACGFFLYQPQVSSSLVKINTAVFYNDEPVQYGATRPCFQGFYNVKQSLEPSPQVSQHPTSADRICPKTRLTNPSAVPLPNLRYMEASTMASTHHKGMVILGTISARTS